MSIILGVAFVVGCFLLQLGIFEVWLHFYKKRQQTEAIRQCEAQSREIDEWLERRLRAIEMEGRTRVPQFYKDIVGPGGIHDRFMKATSPPPLPDREERLRRILDGE